MAKMTELAPSYTVAAALLSRKIKQLEAEGANPYIIGQLREARRQTRHVKSVLLSYYDSDRPVDITMGNPLKATRRRRGY